MKIKKKKRHISLSYIMLAVLTVMVCSGIFRPVLFRASTDGENLTESPQPVPHIAAVETQDLKESSIRNSNRARFAIGAYADVYHYVDMLTDVKHRDLRIEQESTGIYSLYNEPSGEAVNVLQLTDIHLIGAEEHYKDDILAVDAVYTMIERTHPDFIVVTGDIIFGGAGYSSEYGMRAWDVFSCLMDKIGIPWTWTFGNHDHSFIDAFSGEEKKQLLSWCNTLYMCDISEPVSGYSNGMVQVRNSDGSLCTALILLDSQNEIIDENGNSSGYDYIKQDQIDWYEQQVRSLQTADGQDAKSMVFMHIPIEEYRDAWEALQQKKEGVSLIEGQKKEIVSCSPVQTRLFEKAAELGSTKAFFCGHDHLNNFHLEYFGIHLVYAKSIDYVAYPGIDLLTEQRGATLIEMDADGRFSVKQLKLET